MSRPPSTQLSEILELIKHHRQVQDISQKEVAKRMGCNVSFVQALEYKPDVDRRWGTILKYAEAVGVSLEVEVIR